MEFDSVGSKIMFKVFVWVCYIIYISSELFWHTIIQLFTHQESVTPSHWTLHPSCPSCWQRRGWGASWPGYQDAAISVRAWMLLVCNHSLNLFGGQSKYSVPWPPKFLGDKSKIIGGRRSKKGRNASFRKIRGWGWRGEGKIICWEFEVK